MRYRSFITLTFASLLGGCFSLTRVETDIHTITIRDTTVREDAVNPPGEREGGTIYPSPRSVEISRRYLQRDSIVNRYYPAFLRFGGIEAMSFLSLGGTTSGAGNGLFGLYDLMTERRTTDNTVFSGWFYRLMPYEVRLRWFNDAVDWTVGTAGMEGFFRKLDDSSGLSPGEYLIGILPGYIRKRFVLRHDPPYLMITPFAGASAFPSQYLNAGVTLDVGSFGGFNARGYLGFVSGASNWFADSGDTRDYSATFPYFGIGVSALDFVNLTEELYIEWKNHRHSAIEVSVLDATMVRSFSAEDGWLGDSLTGNSPAVSGLIVRLASADVPLPFADGRFYLGTTLLNVMGLSGTEFGYGYLPVRAGYRLSVGSEDLTFEPFAEYTYYPSSMLNLALRASMRVAEWTRAEAVLGYAKGRTPVSAIRGLETALTELKLQDISNFSTVYFGVGLGLGTVFHSPEEVFRP